MESLEQRQLLTAVTFNFNPADFFENDPAGQAPGSPEWRDGGLFEVQETGGFLGGPVHGSWDPVGHATLDGLKASLGANEGIGEVQAYLLKSPDTSSATYDWGQEVTAAPGMPPKGGAPAGWTAQGATDAGNAWVFQWEADSSDYLIGPGDDLGVFSLSFESGEPVTLGSDYTLWFGGENYPGFVPAIGFDNWDPGGVGFPSVAGTAVAPGTAYQATVSLAATDPVVHTGSVVTVTGTGGADTFTFAPVLDVAQQVVSYDVGINGIEYNFAAAAVDNVAFNGGAGQDTATITGLPGTDTLNWADYQLALTASGVSVGTIAVETVTVISGGGDDEAFLTDSNGDDLFTATPDSAVLEATDYKITVGGYRYVHAYSTKLGTDEARFVDSPGRDKLKAEWESAGATGSVTKMYGSGGYYNRAKFFEKTVANFSEGGDADNAKLWDSPEFDTFEGGQDDFRFYSNVAAFDITVRGADFVTAYGSENGGRDALILRDSARKDELVAKSNKVLLVDRITSGTIFGITARGFKQVTATADQGGDDIAKLYDTIRDELWEARYQGGQTWSKMASSSRVLYNDIIGFETVSGRGFYGGVNTLQKTLLPGEVDFVMLEGDWEEA